MGISVLTAVVFWIGLGFLFLEFFVLFCIFEMRDYNPWRSGEKQVEAGLHG